MKRAVKVAIAVKRWTGSDRAALTTYRALSEIGGQWFSARYAMVEAFGECAPFILAAFVGCVLMALMASLAGAK